jgi:hypothetical protein
MRDGEEKNRARNNIRVIFETRINREINMRGANREI